MLYSLVQGTVLDGKDKKVHAIPAFGHAEFEFNVRTKNLVESYDDIVKFCVAGQTFQEPI